MINYLLPLLSPFLKALEMRDSQRQRKSEIISTLRSALRDTKLHIENTRTNDFGADNFNEVASTDLSDKWSRVAEIIRPLDGRLAYIFEDKSDYWSNPQGFRLSIQDENRRFSYRIRLEEVEQELIKLEKSF